VVGTALRFGRPDFPGACRLRGERFAVSILATPHCRAATRATANEKLLFVMAITSCDEGLCHSGLPVQ
jgi:hypothetical protein